MSDLRTSVYDKLDDFGVPIVKVPLLCGDVPRLPSFVFFFFYIFQLVRFPGCCTYVLDFHSNIFRSLPNYWHRVTDITNFEKLFESSSCHTLSIYPNLVKYRFKNMFLKELVTVQCFRKDLYMAVEGPSLITGTNFLLRRRLTIFVSNETKLLLTLLRLKARSP